MTFMRQGFVTAVFVLLAAGLASRPLIADAIASVTVQTDIAGSSCELTSSGAEIQCEGPGMSNLLIASGSASAGVGFLSVNVSTNYLLGPPPANISASANASASYDYQIIFPGAASGNIVGLYAVTTHANPVGGGSFGGVTVSNGGGEGSFPIEAPEGTTTLSLGFSYVAGQPVEITGSMNAAVQAPNEGASAELTLMSFANAQTGSPMPFVVVPEPAYWPALGLCLVVMWRARVFAITRGR